MTTNDQALDLHTLKQSAPRLHARLIAYEEQVAGQQAEIARLRGELEQARAALARASGGLQAADDLIDLLYTDAFNAAPTMDYRLRMVDDVATTKRAMRAVYQQLQASDTAAELSAEAGSESE